MLFRIFIFYSHLCLSLSLMRITTFSFVMYLVWVPLIHGYDSESLQIYCVQRDIEKYELVPAEEGDRIVLVCGTCSKRNTTENVIKPHLWYRRQLPDESTWKEIELSMMSPLTANRVYQDVVKKSLVIQRFIAAQDTGHYQCRDIDDFARASYLVDALTNGENKTEDQVMKTGDELAWRNFVSSTLDPLGKKIDMIAGDEAPDVSPLWSRWSPCEMCGYTGLGWRFRIARCRVVAPASLRLLPYNLTSLSCSSQLLHLPNITTQLQNVPDFQLQAQCECNSDSATFVELAADALSPVHELIEGDNLNLVCPGMAKHGHVEWKRGFLTVKVGERINVGRAARIHVDGVGVLHIQHAEREVAGRYSCRVAKRTWRYVVIVKETFVLNTENFHRHVLYLLFVLSLCLMVYLAYLMLLCFEPPHIRAKIAAGSLKLV